MNKNNLEEKTKEFNNLRTTKLGDVGEEIVDNWFYLEGFDEWGTTDIYSVDHEKSHIIDRVVFTGGSVICFDVKTKTSRDLYPDISIDTPDYKKYKSLAENGNYVMVFFVDYKLKKCYGGFLSGVRKEKGIDSECWVDGRRYPFHVDSYGKGVTYLPLQNMTDYFSLSDDDIERLKPFIGGNKQDY